MEETYLTCHTCGNRYSRKDSLTRHMRSVHKVRHAENHVCQRCGKEYQRQYNFNAHVALCKIPCTETDEMDKKIAHLDEKMEKMCEKINKIDKIEEMCDKIDRTLTVSPSLSLTPTQQNLNVMCMCPKADFLGILTQEFGSEGKALEYITNCAMSDVSGDSHLMARLYIKEDQSALHYDPSRKYITYHDAQHKPHVEDLDLFGHTMGNCLQNVYLVGINRLMGDTLDTCRDPNQLLDTYDFLEWNQHLSRLGQKDHQRKVIRNLTIPVKHPIGQC
jgi:hypothetical protein